MGNAALRLNAPKRAEFLIDWIPIDANATISKSSFSARVIRAVLRVRGAPIRYASRRQVLTKDMRSEAQEFSGSALRQT